MKIGINGFGRIGKSIFIQLLCHPYFKISAINAIKLDIHSIEKYLKYDSTHVYDKNFKIVILDESHFEISYLNRIHIVRLIRERDASKINWDVDLLFEASGAYLTQEKCKTHNVPYIIITAPAKDNSESGQSARSARIDKTPTYVYGVNEKSYNGESIISNASCTTNCITPFLKFMNDYYKIESSSFTTIHSSTSSQSILDNPENNAKSSRSSRSIFNNLIPATTGASSAVKAVIPELDGKIQGMVLRVPTNNVSVVDIVIETEYECLKDDLFKKLEIENKYKNVMYIEKEELVSCDFNSTTTPTILDKSSFLQLDDNKIKLLIWYDNEWSYASQTIRMGEIIYDYIQKKSMKYNYIHDYISFKDTSILMRVDYNVPMNSNNQIVDNFRIKSTIETIERLLRDKPKRIILATHLGRPDPKNINSNSKYSTIHLLEELIKLCNQKIYFLKNGLSKETLEDISEIENSNYMYSLYEMDEYISPKVLQKCEMPKIYLLENVRFHEDETNFEKSNFDPSQSEVYQIWNQLGNVFVNCAFGCAHRNHLTINGFKSGPIYYDSLIEKELNALEAITENKEKKKILAILGGAKIDDKLPLCKSLIEKVDKLYLGGGIINSYIYNETHSSFIDSLGNKIELMEDGFGNNNFHEKEVKYLNGYIIENNYYYDIGEKSLKQLFSMIRQSDIIFWNGTMGITEHELYKNGSIQLLEYLLKCNKEIIIGGGDTAGFVNQYLKSKNIDIKEKKIHICTGGGASLEFIINNSLVGIHQKN